MLTLRTSRDMTHCICVTAVVIIEIIEKQSRFFSRATTNVVLKI